MQDIISVNGIDYKVVPGFDGRFAVSKCGKMISTKSLRRYNLFKTGGGYVGVGTHINGKVVSQLVHRLLLLAWDPHPDAETLEVNHKDLNRQNCHLDNLEWVTRAENMQHRVANQHYPVGEKNHFSKLTWDDVREIRRLSKSGVKSRVIATQFGVRPNTISPIIHNKNWKEAA